MTDLEGIQAAGIHIVSFSDDRKRLFGYDLMTRRAFFKNGEYQGNDLVKMGSIEFVDWAAPLIKSLKYIIDYNAKGKFFTLIQDVPATKVKFYYHEKNDDLFAFFLKQDHPETGYYTAYSHVGQHSQCHLDYVMESREATREEFGDLYSELTDVIGYNLKIVK